MKCPHGYIRWDTQCDTVDVNKQGVISETLYVMIIKLQRKISSLKGVYSNNTVLGIECPPPPPPPAHFNQSPDLSETNAWIHNCNSGFVWDVIAHTLFQRRFNQTTIEVSACMSINTPSWCSRANSSISLSRCCFAWYLWVNQIRAFAFLGNDDNLRTHLLTLFNLAPIMDK